MLKRRLLISLALAAVVALPVIGVIEFRRHEVSFDSCSAKLGEARSACFGNLARRDAKQLGITASQKRWHDRVATDQSVESSCHVAWHPVGESYGKKLRSQGKQLHVMRAHDRCEEGYVHGVMLGYLGSSTISPKQFPSLAAYCITSTGIDGSALNCAHGIGHVLQREARSAFSETTVEGCTYLDTALHARSSSGTTDASTEISAFFPPKSLRNQCLRGAFMEQAFAQPRAAGYQQIVRRTSDGCTAYPSAELQAACFNEFTMLVTLAFPDAGDRVLTACTKAPQRWQTACARGLGISDGMLESCHKLRGTLRSACTEGVKSLGAASPGPPA